METYMTIEELANYLNFAEQTIRRWVAKREIPFHKVKGAIRFRLSEIEWWIEKGVFISSDAENRASEIDVARDVISLDELREEEEAQETDSGELE